ncbi:malonyl CoA-acyl carrier protein transacylase [Reticulomyxa filosa]|uniref:[acyl-carrier-protein] S-malonyltransferase n=1 Tax=Reticulomyxa filosa TaxID=46433 RepID=X6MG74_RETFI|nr:malonyl CoA-acyl carrier protein transacylase [Reticulomyxa filosa]|eukprot:ETO12055.1 malonyl CoA-acyl carrier protein transacylase [Reticulomyxa filosa]
MFQSKCLEFDTISLQHEKFSKKRFKKNFVRNWHHLDIPNPFPRLVCCWRYYGSTRPGATRCLLFPGQASQYVGMCKDLYDAIPSVKNLLDETDECLGYSLTNIINFKLFKYTKFKSEIKKNDVMLGHSLGELTALYAAGYFEKENNLKKEESWKNALKLVECRAKAMNKCCNKDNQCMYAIIGAKLEWIKEIIEKECKIKENNSYIINIANINSSKQIVISGNNEIIKKVINKILLLNQQSKSIRILMINTSGAFHSNLMKPSINYLKDYINENKQIFNFNINNSKNDIIFNLNAKRYKSIEIINNQILEDLLCNQLISSVLWNDSIIKCLKDGITDFIEIGPKRILSSLVLQIAQEQGFQKDQLRIYNIDKIEDFNQIKKLFSF